ncbi:MAG: hypothetical protein B9S33_20385 [Pedosphaera sp. Tous-C6FEB]|nr:MAG: hypothetical protein B9S33_20385 [Pedosphaera sp. Tous-C6FEB]
MGLALIGLLAPLLLGIRLPGEPVIAPATDNWAFAFERRVRARAERITKPKVVFVGGSNLLFGMNARSLGEQIDRPVVNYGWIGPLGLDVIAERAGEIVRPGDWVVIAPEYGHFYEFKTNDWRTAWLAARTPAVPPAWWQGLWSRERARQKCAAVPAWLSIPTESFSSRPFVRSGKASGAYELAAFGPDGELLLKRPDAAPSIARSVPEAGKQLDFSTSVGVAGFEHLRKICEQQGARLAVMPPIRVTEPEQDYALIEEFERRWVAFARERGAAVLIEAGGSTLPGKQYAFDTEYHLNDLGVQHMEGRLTVALLKLFARPPQLPVPASKGPD